MSTIAYTLRAEYEDSGFGGVLAYGETRESFDVAEALELGGGKIVTEDPLLIAALDQYPALKRTTAGDAPQAALPGVPAEEQPENVATPERADLVTELEAKSADELRDEAKEAGLDLPGNAKKDALVQAIANHRLSGDDE